MAKKGDAPAPPDYSQLAQSSVDVAKIQQQTSNDQLAWAKQQYADIAPYAKSYLQSTTDISNNQIAQAKAQQDFYNKTYQPIESQFAGEASGYNSPERAQQQSAAAQENVASAYAGQRQQALSNLESYGIDPSQTRYGALDLGTRISQAATQAAAGTQSRLNTEATGLALQGEAINIGRGYPGAVAQSYGTAINAGQAGIGAANQTFSTGGGQMGTPVQYGALSTANMAGGLNATRAGFQDQLAAYNAANATAGATMGGIGSLVGGVATAAIGAIAI